MPASLSLSGSGGTLHYFAEGLPPGIVINPSTGAITGTMAVGDSTYAPYTVTVIATNGSGQRQRWRPSPGRLGGGVTMTPVADQTSNEGGSVSCRSSASDSSSGTLSYSAVGLRRLHQREHRGRHRDHRPSRGGGAVYRSRYGRGRYVQAPARPSPDD